MARLITLSIAVVSLGLLVWSSIELAKRIEKYHLDNPRPLFYSIRTDLMQFEFEGRPVVFESDLNEAGEGTVSLAYGDRATRTFAVEVPKDFSLPGLDQFIDWMQVFFFAENSEREPLGAFRDKVQTGEADLRSVVVVRRVEAASSEQRGPIAESLGVEAPVEQFREVRRDRWTFDFHELMPDGGIETHTLRMPESGASFYRRQVRAYERDEPEPQRADDELRERTWEWDLALQTMPRAPSITKENQALLYAGWTLPTASGAAIIFLFATAFTFAPQRRNP